MFVIDWDEVMLAPKERDFLFVKEAPADGLVRLSTPAFFQGYGQTEIDWIALGKCFSGMIWEKEPGQMLSSYFMVGLGEGPSLDCPSI